MNIYSLARTTYRFELALDWSKDARPTLSAGDGGWNDDPPTPVPNLLIPSKDLLWCDGRSKTRNEGVTVGSGSSRTFPDDLRRGNPLGSLMGM